MTVGQDQTSKTDRSTVTVDPTVNTASVGEGQPMSRRELRERERRAAAALAAGQVHPSGVVDFAPHDLGSDFVPDDFGVHDTADIWAALSRRSDQTAEAIGEPEAPAHGRRAAQDVVSAPSRAADQVAEAPLEAAASETAPVLAPMSDELLDRVREVVFREHQQARAEAPRTRREARAKRAAETIDGMPAAWFQVEGEQSAPEAPVTGPSEEVAKVPAAVEPPVEAGSGAVDEASTVAVVEPLAPVPAAFAVQHFPPVDEAEPAPTVAMSVVDRAEQLASVSLAEPPALPHVDASPVGEDAIVFSSAPESATSFVEARPNTAAEAPAPAFQEPGPATGMVPGLAGFEAMIEQARRNREAGLPAAGAPDAPTAFVATDPTFAMNGTGEHLVTGSFRLPQSVSATGASSDAVDSADVDQFLDLAPEQQKRSNVAPVAASRAVSGSVPTSAVPLDRRSRSSVLPTVLAIVAGVMAVGVVVLLVGSWVLKLF